MNRQSEVTADYLYNAMVQRVKKVLSGSITATKRRVYDLNGNTLAVLNGSGAVIQEYIYLNGTAVDNDHLGTPWVVTDTYYNYFREGGGITTYNYAGANLISIIDPIGLRPPTEAEEQFIQRFLGTY